MLSFHIFASWAAAGVIAANDPAAAATPPKSTMPTVAAISRRCDAAEKATRGKPNRVFADVSDKVMPAKGQGTWREFPDPDALKGVTEEGAPNTQALVWRFPDGVLYVVMFFQSGSGDWAQYADHCFRPDGTLARVTDTFNTFEAGDDDSQGISRIRIKYFSPDGTMLQKKSRLLDLQTRKPVKRRYMDQDDVAYARVSDVPFFELLKDVKP
jgi:hypothetical protein